MLPVSLRSCLVLLAALLVLAGVSSHARADWTPLGNEVVVYSADQNLGQAVPDGAGGALLLFRDRRNYVQFINPCIDIFGQHVEVDGSIAPGWTLDGSPVSAASAVMTLVHSAPDGAGGAFATVLLDYYAVGGSGRAVLVHHVPGSGAGPYSPNHWLVWSEFGAGGGGLALDGVGGVFVAGHDASQSCVSGDCLLKVYVGRYDAALASLPGWPVRVRVGSGTQHNAELAPDGAQGVFVLWRDLRNATPDLYAQHLLPNGTRDPAWPVDGLALGGTVNVLAAHKVIADGQGGLFAAWIDGRAGRTDLYAQHLDATGAPVSGWPAGGLLLHGAAGLAVQLPALQSDGSQGSSLAWVEKAGANPKELHALRLGSDGTPAPGWPAAGRVIAASNFLGNPDPPVFTPGVGSDAFLAWTDQGGPKLLRLDGAGADFAGWPAGGVLLPSGALALAADPWGGVLVSWDAFSIENGTTDIRALRVGADGALGSLVGVGPGPSAGSAWSLGRAVPNPARGMVSCALTLPAAARVEASVLDVRGRLLKVLATGTVLPAGEQRLSWDGNDLLGRSASAGMYLLRVRIDGETRVARLVRLGR